MLFLTSVCLTSVAFIGPNLRTELPRKTKIGTALAHVTRDSDTTFKVKGQGHQAALVGCSSHYIIYIDNTIIITRVSRCLSIMNIHGTRCAERHRRKAYMGGSWAAACSVHGRGHIVRPRAQIASIDSAEQALAVNPNHTV